MAQKTNPNSLRPNLPIYRGVPIWEQSQFNYINRSVEKIINACCKKSDLYTNNIQVFSSHETILITVDCLQLYSEAQKKSQSRRFKENTQDYRRKYTKESWKTLLKRFYKVTRIIQEYTGFKKVKLRIHRLKAYSLGIQKSERQKTYYYTRNINRGKFLYARSGIQLINLITKNKATPACLAAFIRDILRTRSRRRNHTDVLRFLKQSFDTFGSKKKIKGIKIALKGRFGHKPKARSRIWKYQLGTMPFNRFSAPIRAQYRQIQTKLGAVGIKVWVHH